MYRLVLESKKLPVPTNVTENWHYRKRGDYRKSWRLWVKYSVGKDRPETPLSRARITIDVYDTGKSDRMNARHSFKPIIDGLCPERSYMRGGRRVVAHGAGVILDDRPNVIGEPEFNWHRCLPHRKRFVLVVEEIEDG